MSLRQLRAKRTPEMLAALCALRRELRGRPYESSKLEVIKAAYDGPLGRNDEDLSSLFCGELVAEAYQAMGLLPGDSPSSEYVPSDFSSERSLPLLQGARLGRETVLKHG